MGGLWLLIPVSITVDQGTAVAVLGAKGAGKTTLLRAISGLVSITSGEIWLGETRISGMKPPDIVRLGVVHVPEVRRLFPDLSVLNNPSWVRP